MQDRNLISYDASTQLFLITDKGLRFMHAFEKISELIPNAEIRKNSKENELKISEVKTGTYDF